MIESLSTILQENCRLTHDRPVVVGFSGGPDSLCLLHLLWRLGYPLIAAHFNHGLRTEAAADAAAAARAAEVLGLPFHMEEGNVRAEAGAGGLSIEEAGREARYRFLFAYARRVGAQAVAVGHTADDQAETVLMHLLRGSGLSGLGGMRYRSFQPLWSEEIPLVRPLLGIWRAEVDRYLSEQGLQPVLDASNLDPTYFRNRLRNHLIPILEEYNPRVKKLLWQTALILQGDEAVLEEAVEAAWQACTPEVREDALSLSLEPFRALSTGLQRRVLRQAVGRLRPALRDIGFETVERGLAFINRTGQGGQLDLASGLRLSREGERVWVSGWTTDLPAGEWPAFPGEKSLLLEVPGRLALSGGWVLEAAVVEEGAFPECSSARTPPSQPVDPFQAWLDLDRLALPLLVRSRLPGDRFRPLGMEGHSIKLSDYFINVKLPRRARHAWPLVLSGGEIAWLPGYLPAEPFRLTPATRRALYLRLRKADAAGGML